MIVFDSILFADIVNFTKLAGSPSITAQDLVKVLNELYGKFDQCAKVSDTY